MCFQPRFLAIRRFVDDLSRLSKWLEISYMLLEIFKGAAFFGIILPISSIYFLRF